MNTLHATKTTLCTLLLTGLIALGLSGCGSSDEPTISYEGPIAGWEDVIVPENANWEKSLIGGTVENHTFTVPLMSEAEFFVFEESTMTDNGWLPNQSGEDTRQFVKDGDVVTFNSNGVADGKLTFVIIIEPAGVYENEEEVEEESGA